MESMHRRRVVAALVGAALAIGGLAACVHRWPTPPRPTTTTTSATITWPGSWTPPTTTTGTVPGTIDCGVAAPWGGPPVTMYPTSRVRSNDIDLAQGAGKCFVDAWAAGTPARLVTGRPSGNDPLQADAVLVWDILGPGRVRITGEDTGTDPPTPVVQYECTGIAISASRLVPGPCQPQPPAAPPFGGRACGRLSYGAGWPTTFYTSLDQGPGKCLVDAWDADTAARLEVNEYNMGVNPVFTTYDVLGTGQLRVITDNRPAGGTGVTVQYCTSLTHDRERLHPGDCTPG